MSQKREIADLITRKEFLVLILDTSELLGDLNYFLDIRFLSLCSRLAHQIPIRSEGRMVSYLFLRGNSALFAFLGIAHPGHCAANQLQPKICHRKKGPNFAVDQVSSFLAPNHRLSLRIFPDRRQKFFPHTDHGTYHVCSLSVAYFPTC